MTIELDQAGETANRELDMAITRLEARLAEGVPFLEVWAAERDALIREGDGKIDAVQQANILVSRLAMATARMAHQRHRAAYPTLAHTIGNPVT